jgi:hypothetical protein
MLALQRTSSRNMKYKPRRQLKRKTLISGLGKSYDLGMSCQDLHSLELIITENFGLHLNVVKMLMLVK